MITQVDLGVLQDLFDHVPDIVFFVKDPQCRYVAVNQSLLQRFGLKHRQQILGKRLDEVSSDEFGRIPTEQDEEILRTGRPLIKRLELQRYRTQLPGWCLTTKIPLKADDGTIEGLIGITCDVRIPTEQEDIPVSFANALREFEQTLAPEVTPSWLSEKSGLSPQRLARLTKRFFGLTPIQLITKTRVEAASRLLKEGEMTVGEIATHCGFADHSSFSRAFRSTTGVAPTVYREKNLP